MGQARDYVSSIQRVQQENSELRASYQQENEQLQKEFKKYCQQANQTEQMLLETSRESGNDGNGTTRSKGSSWSTAKNICKSIT